jgi:hypothetical protein
VAARLRRELEADVDMVHGHYGEFKVLVDGQTAVDGGSLAFLGILPSAGAIVDVVKSRLKSAPPASAP